MSLFVKWSGNLKLPEIKLQQFKVGKNNVSQLLFGEVIISGEIFDYQHATGHDLLVTELDYPYNNILIRRSGAKKILNPEFSVIKSKSNNYSYEALNESFSFSWENVDLLLKGVKKSPNDIVDSWTGKLVFKKEDADSNILGFRAPQLGALHAIIAHFSVGDKFEPATIVLPTGTGKTETMLASLVYNKHNKLLVIVPSKALRHQIHSKFSSLGFLPLIGVLPPNISRPLVSKIEKGIKLADEAKELVEKTNVIIATPNILRASSEEARKVIFEMCTDLYIDEAHHSSAKTWNSIREKFLNKRITQFTATPYRTDGKHIGGNIIFNYKLGNAQKDKYFKPIRLKTIEEWGTDEERNEEIAKVAIETLRRDIEIDKNDHLMMARVDKTGKADKLLLLYNKLAPEYKPQVVYADKGVRHNERCLNNLKNRSSRIIICVDMLGEGFDMPNLKVVAIHDGHKSLAVTLQFIGRFTRKANNVGDAAAIINVADTKTEKNLQKLYSEGANWDILLQRLSEDRIEKEKKLQDIIESLKANGNLHDEISLWNLTPSFTTQIYTTECEDWNPYLYDKVLPKAMENWYAISEEKKLLIVLGLQEVPVKWGSHQNLLDIKYKLLIAYWNEKTKALFVYSNDYNGFRVDKFVDKITQDQATLLNGTKVFNILNNVELPLVKNLGASKVGAISFTSYFGPNVTDGLALIEKNESELNNIACVGYEDGDRVIWGGTQKKGKIWSVKSGSIHDWIEWCEKTWEKVSDESTEESNIIRDFLKPVKLTEDYNGTAISAQWGEHVQSKRSDRVTVLFGEIEKPLFLTDISINNIGEENPILISIKSEEVESVYSFKVDPTNKNGYEYKLVSGEPISFKYGKGEKRPLEEHVIKDPFIIYYHDSTYSYNCYHIPTRLDVGQLSDEMIEVWDWTGIPLNQESMGKEVKKDTIQYKTFKELENDYDFIFNDDGTGEAGDLVALKDIDENTILLCLVHCKNAKKGIPSGEIENLYTVCGQAQKSIRVKHSGIQKLSSDLRRRHEKWRKEGFSRLLKGDLKTLAYFQEKSRKAKVEFEVMIVQPGLKKISVTNDILKLLGTTELYLKKTSNANFRVIGF